ncbi:MAG: UvrD-helicase domain-containing protein [Lentisphaerae bacterium]|nr:UvrD-helicase domain-containing protein [Lentisphaerota bacterium]
MNVKRNMAGKIKNEVISASAGTGKTYQLVNRYLKLLATGVKPETIVAMTFTRNAAGEIFDRIISRISLMIKKPEVMKSPEYLASGIPQMSEEELQKTLRRLLLSLHLLPIGTLDSFFVRIIKTFSFEFGLSGDFEIIDESLVEQAKRKVLRNILWNIEYADKDVRGEFVEEFKKATFGKEEKRLTEILDGFVKEYHYKYLCAPDPDKWGNADMIWPDGSEVLKCKINPAEEADKLTTLLESKKLSDKQRDKFNEFVETVRTFRPESYFDFDSAFNKNLFRILPELEEGRAQLTVGTKVELSEEECECLLKLARHIMKCQISAQLHKTEGVYGLIRRYEEFYNQMIRQGGKLTFADIPFILSPDSAQADKAGMGENHYVLSENYSGPEDRLYIDYRLDSRFDHWLIDEFQDTSYPQWRIIKNLIDEIVQDDSGGRSFFYVGDVKQAIYGWREGEATLFKSIYEGYKEYTDIELKRLSRSFRSSGEVIETVNQVFSNLNSIEELPLNVRARWDWEEHKAKEKNKDGSPAFGGYASLVQLQKTNDGREQKEISVERKVRIIADKIKEITPFERGLSVAVLVSQNKTGREIAELLQAEGIKVAIEGQFHLTDNPLVTAFLSLAKFAEHPADNFAWQHLRMTPFAVLLKSQDETSAEVLDDIYRNGFAYFIQKWSRRLAGVCFDEFSQRRLDQFVAAAQIFDRSGEKNCLDFIEYIKNYTIPGETVDDAVQIMTVYKAKGLEFDIVFLAEIKTKGITTADIQGIRAKKNRDLSVEWLMFMPNRRIAELDPVLNGLVADLDDDTCYEYLCVLYVAMTRAAEALYMMTDPPPKTKSDTLYLEDVLLKALATRDDSESYDGVKLLYENGNPAWYECYPKEKTGEEASGGKIELSVDFGDVLKTMTPSGSEERTLFAGTLFGSISDTAAKTGSAVHELFEKLQWNDTARLETICGEWEKQADYPDKTIAAAKDIFLKSFKHHALRNSLEKPSADAELWREKRFELIVDGTLIRGEFDRVTLIKDKSGKVTDAMILDYKTDLVASDDELVGKVMTYSPQLKLYQKALSLLIKLPAEKISLNLAFVRIGKVVCIG